MRLVTMVEAIKPTVECVCNADTQTPIRTEDNWLLRLKGCLRNVHSLRNLDEWAVRHIVMMSGRWRCLLCSSKPSSTTFYTTILAIAKDQRPVIVVREADILSATQRKRGLAERGVARREWAP